MSRIRDRKREEYLRRTGRGLLVTGAEVRALLARLRSFHARGMSYVQMEDQTGVHHRTIAFMVQKNRARIRRSTYTPLAAIRFEEPYAHTWVDGTGTARRLGALWLAGYPIPFLAERLGFWNRGYIQAVIRRSKDRVEYGNSRRVADLYDKLADRDPLESGIEVRAIKFAQAFARKKGLAPPSCWDPDTIDDPRAIPDWTGLCGTPYGRIAHAVDESEVCAPCAETPGAVFSAQKLSDERERQNLSLTSLEERASLSKGQLHKWEAGAYAPRPAALRKLLSALDASIEDLYEEAPE